LSDMTSLSNIAVFASGTGSNAAKIIAHFKDHASIKVALIVCNNPDAGVLEIADENNVPSVVIERKRFFDGDGYLAVLKEMEISFIVLAGFLWKIPLSVLDAYPGRIVNIHPALLPKYGGKGMYGLRVHQAVIDDKEKESGITIHYVDDKYDNGDIIFQARCPVLENDTAVSLAKRVGELEHKHFPEVVEEVVKSSTAKLQ